jgi:hypothetical protein
MEAGMEAGPCAVLVSCSTPTPLNPPALHTHAGIHTLSPVHHIEILPVRSFYFGLVSSFLPVLGFGLAGLSAASPCFLPSLPVGLLVCV